MACWQQAQDPYCMVMSADMALAPTTICVTVVHRGGISGGLDVPPQKLKSWTPVIEVAQGHLLPGYRW